MSWFKRAPKFKSPPKHLPHHFNSPMALMILEETKIKQKEQVSEKDKLTRKNNENK